jgi:hypothetical protein
MAIPDDHKWRYIFHFTDVHNLDSIIKNGLLCTNVKNEKSIQHKNIANMTIQGRRAKMDVPVGPGGKVHDYVPFYFSSMNPMLLTLLNQKNVDQQYIIYFCVKIDRLEKEDAVFANASANTVEPPTFYDDVANLNQLDWNAIDNKSWGVASDEERHKKMAEALIHDKVKISDIDAILVFNECIKKCVEQIFKENGVKVPAIIYDHDIRVRNYSFYYTKFFIEALKQDSLVTGPSTLLYLYRNLKESVKKIRQTPKASYPYATISDLVDAINDDFTVLQELKAVSGLLQDYDPHNDTVDEHTKEVVCEMKKTAYYKSASEELKSVLELAAYLHDIGKGPMSKWKEGKMKRAYPDHPADAIPMLKRILTEEIESLTDDNIRRICMMVVYHDIVGDCQVKSRDKQQIADLIENEDDLEMLFAISCADAKAIKPEWGDEIAAGKKVFMHEIMQLKKS